MTLPSLEPLVPEAGRRLVALLRAIGLDREAIRARTEPLDNLKRPLAARRELRHSPASIDRALRLFFCGETLPANDVENAWLDTGLLVEHEGGFSFPFHLRTVQQLYLVSDYLGDHPDAVMGAGETTAILYRAARPPQPVDAILDIGCGAGTLALLLAADARRAVGADINPRAIVLSQFNAAANNIANAEFRCGDLYQPAAQERFDRIVAQPPYYPNPAGEAGLTFLHGGRIGDELALRCVEEAPHYLSPDGVALIFASWSVGRELPPGIREFYTNRRELHGTRQSLTLINHHPRQGFRRQIAPERWGELDAARIARITRAENAAALPDHELHALPVRRAQGWTVIEEGDPIALSHPEHGTLVLSEALWQHPGQHLREALRRGLLEPL